MKNDMITVYVSSEFMGNMLKFEGKLQEHGERKYAQYDKAPFVIFIPKGKRKPTGIQQSYKPTLLILEGTGHPEPESLFTAPTIDENGTKVSRSKYASFDARFTSDFDSLINAHIEKSGAIVIADYRATKG